jgi:predicted dehydrogenase
MAATLDNQIELVCGAFSSDPKKSRKSGRDWYLPENRVYGSYSEMFRKESALPEGDRMDFVAIVTPNHLHFPMAREAIQAGFPVMCEKPMTFDLSEARKLRRLVRKSGLLFGLTHNYTGYPLVKHARDVVKSGALGKIRKIIVEYPQGWLATRLESSGQKQADWRTDPARAGASCCIGDIGTHAENLAETITGLRITEVCADVTSFVRGRKLEDDGNVLLRFEGGAKGVLHASQVSVDEENALAIRVYGESGGLEWHQEEPNSLILKWLDRPREVVRAGVNYAGRISASGIRNSRLPCGHPEGFIEAFANLYRNFAFALRARLEGRKPAPEQLDFPTIDDGVRGMAFIETVLKSSVSKVKWVRFPKV